MSLPFVACTHTSENCEAYGKVHAHTYIDIFTGAHIAIAYEYLHGFIFWGTAME
ncbi:hypothetical protein [Schaalia sp. lx-260]|uniref:hypothetical protein n=1 Tax=Schaalia sp. lx-260 TaxID=2899082 RepID=UPI001E2D3D17|nr:hypothetical protein [Schaalia sp. lx-260]MCD4549445.1 hypothetical protein [Schaalia sp. lx-260]